MEAYLPVFVWPLLIALLFVCLLVSLERWLCRRFPKASFRRLLLDRNTAKHRPARFFAACLFLMFLWMACTAIVSWLRLPNGLPP